MFCISCKTTVYIYVYLTGFGNFGYVYKGTWSNRENGVLTKVAIKQFKQKKIATDMLKEMHAGTALKHENLVEFLGICLESNAIILELMEGGQLLAFLRHSNINMLTLRDQLEFCYDIVKGCAYIEEMKFVHRDLSARNCLLTSKDYQNRKVCVVLASQKLPTIIANFCD